MKQKDHMPRRILLAAAVCGLCLAGAFPLSADTAGGGAKAAGGWQTVAQRGTLTLCADLQTADFYVEDAATGARFSAAVENAAADTVANDTVKDRMRSLLAIEYYDNRNNLYTMNSCADCLAYGQVTAERVGGGFRAVFALGKQDERRLVPQAVTEADLEALLSRLPEADARRLKSYYLRRSLEDTTDKAEQKALLAQYPKLSETALYVLRPKTSERAQSQIEGYLQGLGLTLDDVDDLHERAGVTAETEKNPVFTIPVEVRLDKDGLVTEIDTEHIRVPDGYVLSRIRFLEYFASPDGGAEGSFFLPDGSGALISLNGDAKVRSTVLPLYGADDALKTEENAYFGQTARLPVFGLDRIGYGCMAVVESGALLANINAELSGLTSSRSHIYADFTVSPSAFMEYEGRMQAKGVWIFPEDISRTPIRLRWFFLQKAGYTDMARRYRAYLLENGSLRPAGAADTNTDAACVIELWGAAKRQASFFGIPYTASVPLTTFSQAEEIVKQAQAAGIGRLSVRFRGLCNGGLSHTAINRMRVQRELGGEKGLAALNTALSALNVTLYPDADFLYADRDVWFDGFTASRDASAFLDRKIATTALFDPASYAVRTENDYRRYVVSPARLDGYVGGFLRDLDKIGIRAVSAGSLGSSVNSDFRRGAVVERNVSAELSKQALARLAEGCRVMIEGGNAYALASASVAVNVPLTSSGLHIESESVPFYALVVHGSVRFTGEAINTVTDRRQAMLRAVECGADLYFCWMYADDRVLQDTPLRRDSYSLCYRDWIEEAGELYGRVAQALAGTAGKEILSHRKRQEGVYETVFDGGVTVLCNYGSEPVTVDGMVIPAEDFIRREGQ